MFAGALRFHPSGDQDGDPSSQRLPPGPAAADGDDLPYRVEIWDEKNTSVELVVAVTANASIGYAAYYAATREYPGRCITLRHKNSVLSRWNCSTH